MDRSLAGCRGHWSCGQVGDHWTGGATGQVGVGGLDRWDNWSGVGWGGGGTGQVGSLDIGGHWVVAHVAGALVGG